MSDVPAGSVFIGSEVVNNITGEKWEVLFISGQLVVLRPFEPRSEIAVSHDNFYKWFNCNGHKPIL